MCYVFTYQGLSLELQLPCKVVIRFSPTDVSILNATMRISTLYKTPLKSPQLSSAVMKHDDSSGAPTLSSVTRNDTLEFRVNRSRVFWRMMHLDKTDVGQRPKNSAQETTNYWYPGPIVSRAVKTKHII